MTSKLPENIKTVLITGCSAGGSGSAFAESFQKRGLHVFATARTLSKMSHLENLPNTTLIELDVISPASIAAALEVVTAQTGGRLDYLVNNSGQALVMPCLDTDMEEAKKLFDVNFWGVIAMTKAFAPLVIASKGTIVNICSVNAHANVPWMGIYNASKAALDIYTETLRLELAPFNVKVIPVIMGSVATNIVYNIPSTSQIPPESIYQKAAENIKAAAKGEGISRMAAKEFADRVVGDVLGGATGRIWRGKVATLVRVVTGFFPTWVVDMALAKNTGLDLLP